MSDSTKTRKLTEHPQAHLVPDMRPEEYAALRDDIARRGILTPLEITTNGTILDGRHRYRVAVELGLAECPTRLAPLNGTTPEEYMIRAALLRRHLSDDQRAALALRWQKAQSAQAQSAAGKKAAAIRDGKIDSDAVSESTRDTRAEAATLFAVPERKIRYMAQVERAAPELMGEIEAGNKTIIEARRELAKGARDEKIATIARNNAPLGTATRYPVIYADPPWRYENPPMGGGNRSIENHYPTMTLEEICALPVKDIAAQDSILYLWATAPKLAECLEVMRAWGFEYRTNFVWIKDKIGMGYHSRNQHELLLVGRRGEIPPPPVEARVSSVVYAPRTDHSAKPVEFYELIESFYPELQKIELFSRSQRDGWSAWGNQA